MDAVRWMAYGIAILSFARGSQQGMRFKKRKGDDANCIRDSMVIMKNPLVVRGVGVALATILLAGVSGQSLPLRILALVLLSGLGVFLYFHFPEKVRTKLSELGNDDTELGHLRKAFAWYNITISCFFIGALVGG